MTPRGGCGECDGAESHKVIPRTSTTFTEKAPPVAEAVPYNSSQHPGSLAISPIITNTGVRIMPASSGGRNASAKRSAGAAFDSGVPDRFDLIAMATRAIVAATTASANQISDPAERTVGGAGDGRGDERAQAHEDPAPAGDGGELGGPRHGLADEAQVLERVRRGSALDGPSRAL